MEKKTPLTSANYELNKKSFKDHEKEVVKDIINAKRLYYTRIFNVYRSDMKKTWKTINETLSKNKQILELPSSFFSSFFFFRKNYLLLSCATSVRPSVVCGNNFFSRYFDI